MPRPPSHPLKSLHARMQLAAHRTSHIKTQWAVPLALTQENRLPQHSHSQPARPQEAAKVLNKNASLQKSRHNVPLRWDCVFLLCSLLPPQEKALSTPGLPKRHSKSGGGIAGYLASALLCLTPGDFIPTGPEV